MTSGTAAARWCSPSIAGEPDPAAEALRRLGVMRVATKYPLSDRVATARAGGHGGDGPPQGSVELAPLVGLADAIADLTATGRTLRENRLRVIDQLGRSTARLIANQAALKPPPPPPPRRW